MSANANSKDPEAFAIVVEIIENWTQEIFCDLFAIRLVGPAFSFALVEMLGMLGFLSLNATTKFNPTQPAAACRFAEHVKMLRDDLWWKAIANITPAVDHRLFTAHPVIRHYQDFAKLPCFEQTRIGNSLIFTTILLSNNTPFGRRPR